MLIRVFRTFDDKLITRAFKRYCKLLLSVPESAVESRLPHLFTKSAEDLLILGRDAVRIVDSVVSYKGFDFS